MNAARQKVEREARCRVCGCAVVEWLDAAHLLSRSLLPQGFDDADAIVPLCSAVKSSGRAAGCHETYDAHRLDLLPYLRPEEELAAVALSQRLTCGPGITQAFRLLGGDDNSDAGADLWSL